MSSPQTTTHNADAGQSGSPERDSSHPDHLRRNLSNRHIQLIAIGGAIGTGLFMGSGKTIHTAGPSIVVAYLVIGIMLFFVMRAMGEVLLFNLRYKSFQDFAADLLGPWAGFFLGWTYWLCWIATGMADLIGVTSYWDYWVHSKGAAVALAVGTLLLLLGLNLLTVKLFGELEFWFAIIKVIAISLLIVAAVVLVVIRYQSSAGHRATVSNLWTHGGFMPAGWTGLFAGFQIAVFAFVGIELVGTTAAETKDPVKTLPRAINAVPIRVLLFYVLALLGIMSVTPWDQVHADSSPFVQMFGLIGFGAAATVMNFVVLTSAASGANSGIYSNSRMLFGLAHKGMAPARFGRLSRSGVPTWGLIFTVVLVGCSVLLTLSQSIMEAFTLVTTVASVLFIFVWSMILISYLRYRKLHPQAHRTSVYPMPGGRVMCWVVLAFFAFVLVLLTQQPDTLEALEMTPLWFILLGVCWLVVRRRTRVDDSGTEAVPPQR
ncbi:amino acid permease [Acidipropionibacterium jensenii]|uniref:Amino acid permease n=1 Tax=Acidipropionibacterium jensenii TaxID=1749 RepID=A0A3Q9UJM1_9ACTN|nr:amino acid permease [Acidipropionibacterium jensenii]